MQIQTILAGLQPRSHYQFQRTFFLPWVAALLVLSPLMFAQASTVKSPVKPTTSQAEAELTRRIKEADSARASRDPEAIGAANRRLTALALRELGQLRLLELAYPQAIELYRSSLEYENRADTQVDIAIANLNAGQVDAAIAEVNKALAAAPDDVRANTVLGRALMRKRQFPEAAAALEKAVQREPDVESMYSLGICYLASKDAKDKDRAARVFNRTLEVAGDSGSLHVLFGRAYRDAEDLPAAAKEFQRALQLDPKTPHAHYFLGLARLSMNEWKPTPDAQSEFAKEAEIYPHDYLANYMLGLTSSEERKYDESDKFLKIAAEANPRSPDPWLYMGLNAYAQEAYPRAEEMFRKAIELTGSDDARSNFQIRRAYIDLGRILTTSGRKDEAEKYLAKARELQNRSMAQTQQSVAQNAAAAGLGDAAGIVALAPAEEEQAAPLMPIATDPFARLDASAFERLNLTPKQRTAAESQEARLRQILGESLNDLATSEAMRSQFGMALTHFQRAEQWNPGTTGLAKNLGLCAYKVSDYREAVRGLSRALEQQPADAPVRAMLGMSYFGENRYADAVKTFTPLGERGMQDQTVGYAWATSLARTGDLKQAADVLKQFERNDLPTDTLVMVGQLWIEIGDYEKAVSVFENALHSNPSLPKAHYFEGLAYLRWERWPEAAAQFQAELNQNPADLDAKYNLGFVELQQSKTDEAFNIFSEVIAAQPSYANAQYQVGKMLLDRGDYDTAISHLEIAARLAPQVDYVHYQLQAAYRKRSRIAEADRELELYKQLKAKAREQSSLPKQNP